MDLLPPGSMPSPNADGDNTRDFPDLWASYMWPSLYPRVIHRYPTTSARDADLAGLGPTSRAFAYVDASDSITAWNGTAWGDAKTSADSGWIAATPNGSWTNAAGQTTAYRRFNGRVEIQGVLIRGAAAPSAFFTLPVGFRPTRQVNFGAHLNSEGIAYQVFVSTLGVVGFASSGYVGGSTAVGSGHSFGGNFLL